jgi:uncharacterized membrane protein (UPF0127 family)
MTRNIFRRREKNNVERGMKNGKRQTAMPTTRLRRDLVIGVCGLSFEIRDRRAIALAAWLCGAAAVMAALSAGCDKGAPPPPPGTDTRAQKLETATIRVGDLPLRVEVADSEAERQKGMMFRPRPGFDEAMLFVFVSDSNVAFWMKNSYADLDLAFIRSDGSIVQTERMRAYNEELVFSREPVRFALEVPAGWLEAHGIAIGTKVAIPEDVAARATP